MSAKGFTIPEEGKLVNLLSPVDIGGAAKVSDYFNLKNASHVDVIVTCGAITNAATITVEESDDASGSNTTAIGFDYYAYGAADDTPGTRTTVANTGVSTGTTNGVMFVISIDASQLTDGYPYLVVKATNAGANVIAMVAVLSGCRYVTPNDGGPTTLT